MKIESNVPPLMESSASPSSAQRISKIVTELLNTILPILQNLERSFRSDGQKALEEISQAATKKSHALFAKGLVVLGEIPAALFSKEAGGALARVATQIGSGFFDATSSKQGSIENIASLQRSDIQERRKSLEGLFENIVSAARQL